MKRMHFVEIHEQSWCPDSFRDGMTGTLQFTSNLLSTFNEVLPPLIKAMRYTGLNQVIDCCSGSGGPWKELIKSLPVESNIPEKIILTDRSPNLETYKDLKQISKGRIDYTSEPIDAMDVPTELKGFRTYFSSFHHFEPHRARLLLRDVLDKKAGIAIFEMLDNSLWSIFFVTAVSSFLTLIAVPFIRPFRWSNVFWTYIIPVLPFAFMFDGVVSCFRTYSIKGLEQLVESLGPNDYEWQIWKHRTRLSPLQVTCLIGHPRSYPT